MFLAFCISGDRWVIFVKEEQSHAHVWKLKWDAGIEKFQNKDYFDKSLR